MTERLGLPPMRPPRSLFWIALVGVAACAHRGGCGGGGGGPADDARAQAACEAWAKAHCGRLEACAPVSIQAGYGDTGACVARSARVCASSLRAPGTGATADTVLGCARAEDAASCEEVVVAKPPPGCDVGGSLPPGSACGDDAQCAGAGDGDRDEAAVTTAAGAPGGGGSGGSPHAPRPPRTHCKIPADQACGACEPLGHEGDGCDSDRDCEHGLICYFTCLAPVGEGEACDGMTRQCAQTAVCLDYRCVRRAGPGAACSPRADACDHDHGLFCDRESKTCAHYVAARPGQPCGVGTVCVGGACAPEDPSEPARCIANAADGARCDAESGPFCNAPARCVNGVCAMPDPTACR